jgi:ketosteroid isomerase-like protein
VQNQATWFEKATSAVNETSKRAIWFCTRNAKEKERNVMLFTRVLFATVGVMLMITLALPPTASTEAAEPLTAASRIHPDCQDHHEPRLCTRMVEELTAELGRFNEVFSHPDADQLADFYHEDAILYVGSAGRFFRGRDEIMNDFFAPLVAGINSATVDIAAFHFRVVSTNLVILYGSPTTLVTFKDGNTVMLPPLPQTLTWVRQGGERARPFVILADHE